MSVDVHRFCACLLYEAHAVGGIRVLAMLLEPAHGTYYRQTQGAVWS